MENQEQIITNFVRVAEQELQVKNKYSVKVF